MDLELKYNQRLRRHVETNLGKFKFRVHDGKRLRRAAVAVTVVRVDGSSDQDDIAYQQNDRDDAAVILTRRSSRLKHHAGQWALPGGSLDDGETPEDTALRELEEEVHLALEKDRILGRLDDFTTRSGFVITPIVIWGGMGAALSANPAEVRSVHRIPFTELLRPDAPILEDNPHRGSPILYMPIGHNCIASPTAALLYQFREVALLGKSTRVAHYEQPLFAWR
jgi:8-oxo-dGTP pyrophosphatase MutT (NUDIX family)